jgi:hypothetical protein
MPEPGPFGETFFDDSTRAMVGALLVNSPAGGCVESVLTLETHRFVFLGVIHSFSRRVLHTAQARLRNMSAGRRVFELSTDQSQQGFEIPAEADAIWFGLIEANAAWWHSLQLLTTALTNCFEIRVTSVASPVFHNLLEQGLPFRHALLLTPYNVFGIPALRAMETSYGNEIPVLGPDT